LKGISQGEKIMLHVYGCLSTMLFLFYKNEEFIQHKIFLVSFFIIIIFIIFYFFVSFSEPSNEEQQFQSGDANL